MHDAFVRTEPAELLFVSQRALERAKAGHEIFDGSPNQSPRIKSSRFTDELIAFAKRKRQADTCPAFVILQFSHRVGINGIFMNRVAAVTVADGKARVARGRFVDDSQRTRRYPSSAPPLM